MWLKKGGIVDGGGAVECQIRSRTKVPANIYIRYLVLCLRYYTLDATNLRCTVSNRHSRSCSTTNAKNSFGVCVRMS
jgi:hypothetical protein